MKRRLDPGQIEVMDDAMAEVLRKKTPAEKIELVAGCYRLARGLVEGRLRTDHPDWDDARIAAEVARRISRGTD
jgi:hypothetical protein